MECRSAIRSEQPNAMPKIRFFCVICGTALQESADSQDDVMECPSCARYVPVPKLAHLPGRFTGSLPVFPPDVIEVSVKFECTSCHRRLRADARWEGRVVVCPVCKAKTGVPRWSTVPHWPRSAEPGKETLKPAAGAPGDAGTARLSTDEIDFLSGPGSKNSGAAA
jgi:DNA-directed RNA polymerase subunit RPC12/RpoP